jgi:formylglycine-generating enzyme required for sulfatase activity
MTDDANILNAFARTVTVGGYPPNAFGLHDVHGNVTEWTLDCLDTGYVGTPNDGSAATSGRCAEARLIRGGHFQDAPARVRFAARSVAPQTMRNNGIGFRVARAL